MSSLDWLRFFHLLAAGVWTGGLIVLGALVFALRKAGADRSLLQAAARQFGRVSWTAMGVAVVTGLAQVQAIGYTWGYERLQYKVLAVACTVLVAGYHQRTAKRATPRARGMVEGLVLVLSLVVFVAAVAM